MHNQDKHTTIVNEHIVLSMAVLLLLMAGLLTSVVSSKSVQQTQTKAASPAVPIQARR